MGHCAFGELHSCRKEATHRVVRTDLGPRLHKKVEADEPADYCLDHAHIVLDNERDYEARLLAWRRWRSQIKDI